MKEENRNLDGWRKVGEEVGQEKERVAQDSRKGG